MVIVLQLPGEDLVGKQMIKIMIICVKLKLCHQRETNRQGSDSHIHYIQWLTSFLTRHLIYTLCSCDNEVTFTVVI